MALAYNSPTACCGFVLGCRYVVAVVYIRFNVFYFACTRCLINFPCHGPYLFAFNIPFVHIQLFSGIFFIVCTQFVICRNTLKKIAALLYMLFVYEEEMIAVVYVGRDLYIYE